MTAPARASVFCYLLLLAAHVGLVWVLPYFPTQDGPSHLYNLVILRDLMHGGREWGDSFSYHLDAVPNLGFNLLAYPLLSFFSTPTVERLFVSLYLVLMGMSIPYFLTSFGRPCLPLSYLVFPAVFSFPMLMGFYSYSIGIPLFLLAFCLAWKMRDRGAACRFVCLNLAGFALFYCHLIAFLLFLLATTAIVLGKGSGYASRARDVLKLLALMSPALLNCALYVSRGSGSPSFDLAYIFSAPRYLYLLKDLLLFTSVNFYQLQILPAALLLFLVSSFGCVSLAEARNRRAQRAGSSASEKTLAYFNTMLLAVYFLAPSHLAGGSLFNQRLPQLILLTTIPLLKMPDARFFRRHGTAMLAGLAGVFLVSNAFVLELQGLKVASFLGGLQSELPKGSYILAYQGGTREPFPIDVLLHASSYYGINNGCVDVGNYEASLSYFPVHFKKSAPAIPSIHQIEQRPSNIKWEDFPSIQYLIGWNRDSGQIKDIGRYFQLFWQDDQLSIWKRVP